MSRRVTAIRERNRIFFLGHKYSRFTVRLRGSTVPAPLPLMKVCLSPLRRVIDDLMEYR